MVGYDLPGPKQEEMLHYYPSQVLQNQLFVDRQHKLTSFPENWYQQENNKCTYTGSPVANHLSLMAAIQLVGQDLSLSLPRHFTGEEPEARGAEWLAQNKKTNNHRSVIIYRLSKARILTKASSRRKKSQPTPKRCTLWFLFVKTHPGI